MGLDEVSRSLARRDDRVVRAPDSLVLAEPLVDTVARTLATPMRRRGAIAVLSGTLLAAAAWRPGLAHGATCQPGETKCVEGGREICAPFGHSCCNSPGCAAAYCREPYMTCGPGGGCDETEAKCATYYIDGPNKTRLCGKQVSESNRCGSFSRIIGTCCHQTETCGANGQCTCPSPGRRCGDQCCTGFTYCEADEFPFCQEYCGDRTRAPSTWRKRCEGMCCSPNEKCGLFGCKCSKSGYSSVGGSCVPRRKDPGDPPYDNPVFRMMWMAQQSSAAHAGAKRRGPPPAQLPPAPTPAAVSALTALAAVNAQGAAAMFGIRGAKRDPRYRSKVEVARVAPPQAFAGPGLDAGSAVAINKLVSAEAKANALILAMSTALSRARAANAARQRGPARTQLRAAASFATQAARAFNALGPLRSAAVKALVDALVNGEVAEVVVGANAVERELAAARASGGVPPALQTAMANLGVTPDDLTRLRSQLGAAPKVGGGCLIAPLRSGTPLFSTGLTQWASEARKHPIAR
jgi:hypothetical protein